MFRLSFTTSGESHGRGLTGIIDGIPANLSISAEYINNQLARRQKGYGRGGRMKIESDTVEIMSGIRWGKTIGSPIALFIKNRDWINWEKAMSSDSAFKDSIEPVTKPRPGHADLPGIIKYNQNDIRNILERSSARETAMRVALGSIARRFLEEFNIFIGSFVTSVGNINLDIDTARLNEDDLIELHKGADVSELRCPDKGVTEKMKHLIDMAKEGGYSLGGRFTTFATGLPVGLGSHIQWNQRLDARLAYAFMGIQAIKAVEIGDGVAISEKPGIEVLDEILPPEKGKTLFDVRRTTNHAGGIEGGMTNSMPVIVKATMKPIPTQRKPLKSIDINTREPVEAAYERSDVCAIAAASVIGEAMMALVIADAFLEKFGGDCMEEVRRNYFSYIDSIR
jgi:chorismate synthase